MGLKAIKVSNSDTNGYDKTIKFSVLMCSDMRGNANKFYCIELQQNEQENKYRIFTHYGRLGSSNVYDIRETDCLSQAEKEYDSILKKKQKGKKKDGYVEKYVPVETFAPTVGSPNIRNVTHKIDDQSITTEAIKDEYKDLDPLVSNLINQICEENIHRISSTMDVVLTSNGFETPLGPVTLSHIEKAKQPLQELKSLFEKHSIVYASSTVKEWNTQFYSLIPHKFGRKISDNDLIMNNDKLNEKFDLLDTLESAVKMGSNLNNNSNARYNALGVEIYVLKDQQEVDRIKKFVYETKAKNHYGMNIWNIKVKNIFTIKLPEERKTFETKGKKIGNILELFHGSRNCNILSIMKNGLKIFKSHPTKAGDMFGPGLYFADNSTKSANYCTGFWTGGRNKNNNYFMFLADVAMGKMKEEFYATMKPAPRGWDSTKGCKKNRSQGSLYNNEYIVYREEQATLKYLIEFEM